LIWAAFRFGQREVATLVALMSLIATWSTLRGLGPFVRPSENESLLLLQAFMATIAALTMPVAALVWERKAVETERTRLLERERAARAEAEDANRAKDEFLAMLSHELRNPLAALANAGQVLHTAPNSAFSGRAIEIVNRQTRHLARLIDDLLDVARVSSGKILLSRERTNLADVVQGCLALLRSSGRLEEHQVSVELQPVWVDADPARLMQIVDNLLLNALRYTPKGGRIAVQTLRELDEAVLRVQDNGAGIAAELLPRIFDLFMQGPRTLDRAQGGLGIGLTLAHRLTLAHGGHITASSGGTGCGSVFTVRLPIAGPIATRVVSAGSAAADKVSPRRILIIEDDADGREALRLQLSQAGHDVYEAATGTDGLEVAARIKPEVVLLDIGLPGLDGYQVAERLRAKDNSPRLIAITGYGQPEDRRRALDAGIEQHLVKPVDPAQLIRLLT
jgi:signal transduction histidine kinase